MPYKETWGDKAKARSKKRKEYFNEYRKKRSKIKLKARSLVFRAVKNGKLTPLNCKFFGNNCRGRIEAHHKDYSKPLDVIWLCSLHHRQEDAKMRDDDIQRFCLSCNTKIVFPKKKYCSDRCNLKGWKKGY